MMETFRKTLPSDKMLKSCPGSLDKNPKNYPFKCKICEAPARYIHFDVLSCESCKIFFKRHVEKRKVSIINYFDLIIIYIHLIRQYSNVILVVNVKLICIIVIYVLIVD